MRTSLLLVALAGCGPLFTFDSLWGGTPDTTPVTGVQAELAEYPVAGGTNNGKTPWSCTEKDPLTVAEAQAVAWSVGAPLVVRVREVHESGGIDCAPGGWTLDSVDSAIWTVAPGSSFEGCSSYAQAVGPGAGRLLAKVDEFTAEIPLEAVAPTSVGFYLLEGGDKPALTRVTELHTPGSYEIVPAPMGPAGRLCGYVPMEVSATGVRFEAGRAIVATGEDAPRGNGPITVFLDRGSLGGTLTVTIAGATGTLPIAPK